MIKSNFKFLKFCRELLNDERNLVFLIVVCGSVMKLFYSLPRGFDLLNSGPDANGWIPAAKAFADKGFFSSEIPFQPFQPSGYPFFLSLLYKFFGEESWVAVVQVSQTFLFALSSVFLYKWIVILFDKRVGLFCLILFTFNPAWLVIAGEAMYENLFGFLLSFYIFLFISSVRRLSHNVPTKLYFFFAGGVAGILSVTHPRALPIVIIMPISMLVFHCFRKVKSILLIYYVPLGIPIIIFGYRNLRAEGLFTLSDATWASFTWNPFFSGCQSLECLSSRTINDPLGFLLQGMMNIFYFLSPHTGLMQRGTWHHNVSLVRFFELQGMQLVSNGFGILISCFTIFTFFLGLWLLRNSLKVYWVLLIPIFIFFATDFIVYGENRHRVIPYLLMLPFQVQGIIHVLRIFPIFRANSKFEKNLYDS